MKRIFGVIGGDRRQAYLAELLRKDGNSVCTYGLAQWENSGEVPLSNAVCADVVVLPLPLCRNPGILNCTGPQIATADLFPLFRDSQLVFAGKISPVQMRQAKSAGIVPVDYLLREEMAVANAVPTAEGALRIAMEHLPQTLCGMNCLVIGYGRIGKLLAHRLTGLGARVTVAARKFEDMAWIYAFGWRGAWTNRLSGNLGQFQAVFNTVPAPVLGRDLLEELPRGCLCIDVASAPGFDVEEAKALGLNAIRALGLPGKSAPLTAATAIRDTLYHILQERGESI